MDEYTGAKLVSLLRDLIKQIGLDDSLDLLYTIFNKTSSEIVFKALLSKDMTVREIVEFGDLSYETVNKNLQIFYKAGLVDYKYKHPPGEVNWNAKEWRLRRE